MKNFRIKLLISLFSLAIIIARIVLPNLNLDIITLGFLVVAALPWFSDLLESAELPGGWKVVFKDIAEIKETQDLQGKQIQRLTFLMNNFLSQNQCDRRSCRVH